MDQNTTLQSLAPNSRVGGTGSRRLVAGEGSLKDFRDLAWVSRPGPNIQGGGIFTPGGGDVEVVQEGVGSQDLRRDGVVPGVERHILDAEVDVEVGLNDVGVSIEPPLGNVDVQVAVVGAVVGEPAWGSSSNVPVVRVVEPD